MTASMKSTDLEVEIAATDRHVVVVAVEAMAIVDVEDLGVMDAGEVVAREVEHEVAVDQTNPNLLHSGNFISLFEFVIQHSHMYFFFVLRHRRRTSMLHHGMCYDGWIAALAS